MQICYMWERVNISLSNIQQICSGLLWKHLVKHMENLYKLMLTNWIEMKTLWEKEKLLLIAMVAVNQGLWVRTKAQPTFFLTFYASLCDKCHQSSNNGLTVYVEKHWKMVENGIEHKQLSVTGIRLNLSLKLLIFSEQFLRHYMQKDCKLYKWKHNWEMFCENQS